MNAKRPTGYVNMYHYPAFGVPLGQRPASPPVNRPHSASSTHPMRAEAGEDREKKRAAKVWLRWHAPVRAQDSREPVTAVPGPRRAEDLDGGAKGGEAERVEGREEESDGARGEPRAEMPSVPVEKPRRKYKRRAVSEGGKSGACGLGERAPAWDEMSPRDAVPVISPLKAAALAAAAAQERSQRAEVRGRPEWWGPRAKTSTQRLLRLRPADPAPPGEESQHSDDASQNDKPASGQPVSLGAFLSEGIKVGTMNIPASAQLLSVGGTSCNYLPFEQVLELIMSAGKGGDLVFDDV